MFAIKFLNFLLLLAVVSLTLVVADVSDPEVVIRNDGTIETEPLPGRPVDTTNAAIDSANDSAETNSEGIKLNKSEPIDPNCPHREHITKCAGQYLDTDQDGKLSRSELQTAINKLPWYGRGILQLLGSVDKMMQKCDVDKDDFISMDYDMVHNADKCLATCFKRKAFKSSFFPECDL